ncbi:uncharacterized protein LOC116113189 [Pistacia vera]|uniref:uncharacterized protein LOC116113189 n=1 Tax=Pistacia vera TaxID=55513 RepID=UPI001263CA3D|nr:uncharacterized protein LOC116113189 [Pistacia vera]
MSLNFVLRYMVLVAPSLGQQFHQDCSSSALYDYLAVVWTLALAVPVLEESYGIEALGKAAKIVKGMDCRILVNLVMTILSFIILLGFKFLKFKDFAAVEVIIGLLILNSLC